MALKVPTHGQDCSSPAPAPDGWDLTVQGAWTPFPPLATAGRRPCRDRVGGGCPPSPKTCHRSWRRRGQGTGWDGKGPWRASLVPCRVGGENRANAPGGGQYRSHAGEQGRWGLDLRWLLWGTSCRKHWRPGSSQSWEARRGGDPCDGRERAPSAWWSGWAQEARTGFSKEGPEG